MKKAFTKILPFLNKGQKARMCKPYGQSLVEFAIALPVLVLVLTAMMEFGFILNFYLSLLDATREAARNVSGGDPFDVDAGTEFWGLAVNNVRVSLDPSLDPNTGGSYQGRRLILEPLADDVIVTVYCVKNGVATAYSDNTGNPSSTGWRLYGNDTSAFTPTSIQSSYLSGAPDAGLVLVEVYYSYHPVIGLFYNSPITLRAHTIMPANAADPSPDCP